ncbi:hypothetical protein GCM10022380_70130 [Amycolatopsis tucumanensis]|uniref:Uncharacterized protein n=1 Tax=Amycolatopsis tucumanensis TaxID=401106 RepID=A0ABP7JD68_9PSEU
MAEVQFDGRDVHPRRGRVRIDTHLVLPAQPVGTHDADRHTVDRCADAGGGERLVHGTDDPVRIGGGIHGGGRQPHLRRPGRQHSGRGRCRRRDRRRAGERFGGEVGEVGQSHRPPPPEVLYGGAQGFRQGDAQGDGDGDQRAALPGRFDGHGGHHDLGDAVLHPASAGQPRPRTALRRGCDVGAKLQARLHDPGSGGGRIDPHAEPDHRSGVASHEQPRRPVTVRVGADIAGPVRAGEHVQERALDPVHVRGAGAPRPAIQPHRHVPLASRQRHDGLLTPGRLDRHGGAGMGVRGKVRQGRQVILPQVLDDPLHGLTGLGLRVPQRGHHHRVPGDRIHRNRGQHDLDGV